ncbi:subunit of the Arp2/3 complex [Chytriomyces hyalinus]|nr:subunit of the Arp2/3 complex [Chytriomyces hyalinus]KAJ3259508.1 subunit of the Arp2/3 complex [Chytriomyces hyalinus]
MPAFHSQFDSSQFRAVGNVSLLPVKSKNRGPAPIPQSPTEDDIVDEAIYVFRPNCFFRNFEIQGGSDRVLIYLLLFIQECLLKLAAKSPNLAEGQRVLQTHAMQNFSLPGDSNFPLNALYEKPATKQDAETLKQYLQQLRMEVALRLPAKVYEGDKLSKWWMCFSKRKFMGLAGVGTLA